MSNYNHKWFEVVSEFLLGIAVKNVVENVINTVVINFETKADD